ncbi:MAG: hypothetical protein LBM67_08440 [Lentimicrobiaceae bacterium]|jgi:hypothetical protein|nr:hypothetical protein [Lentimicrobiaceae bacterium]
MDEKNPKIPETIPKWKTLAIEINPDVEKMTDDELDDFLVSELTSNRDFKSNGEKLSEKLLANPVLAKAISDIISDDMPAELAFRTALELPTDDLPEDILNNENWKNIASERASAAQAKRQFEESLPGNLEKSIETIRTYLKNNDLPAELEQEILASISADYEKLNNLTIDEDDLKKYFKLKNYDSDFENAREAAKLEAMQGKVKAAMAKEAMQSNASGIPVVDNAAMEENTDKVQDLPLVFREALKKPRY